MAASCALGALISLDQANSSAGAASGPSGVYGRRPGTPLGARASACYHGFCMPQESVIPKKRRGPVPTGKGQPIVVRTQPDLLSALDRWIARHPEPKPSRPEAVRRVLVEHLTGERLLPSRTDLRKSRKAAK
jgi:hypothetical protein